MKSLKFEDLRGTNTAVHCPTQEDWDKVSEICGYKWESNAKWSDCGPDTVISLRSISHGVYDGFFSRNGYTIITAADFIAANTEAEQVPQFYKGMEVIAAVSSENHTKGCAYLIYDITNDGKFLSITTDNNSVCGFHSIDFFNYFGLKAKNMSEFEQLQKTVAAMQNQISALEKQLREIEPKPIAEPIEPNPVKLPVTIEEVTSFVNDFEENNETFSGDLNFRTMHRKTQKKILANIQLSLIAEAQNEIAERGEQVWVSCINNHDLIVVYKVTKPIAGEIGFHSEQGLRDCIEANKELWMDLLK